MEIEALLLERAHEALDDAVALAAYSLDRRRFMAAIAGELAALKPDVIPSHITPTPAARL